MGAVARPLRIGELAAAAGTTARRLRFYESASLLRPLRRTPSGYRLYPPDAVERVRFILACRTLGFRLADVRAILDATDAGQPACPHVLEAVERQLGEVEARLQALQSSLEHLRRLRARLVEALERGAAACGPTCPCVTEVAVDESRSSPATVRAARRAGRSRGGPRR